MEECLFIGGCADGEIKQIYVKAAPIIYIMPKHSLYFLRKENPPLAAAKNHEYMAVQFSAGDMRRFIYLYNGHKMSQENAAKEILNRLISGYKNS